MVTPLTKTIGNYNEADKARKKWSSNSSEPIVLEIDIAAKNESEAKPVYYTIPVAAEKAGVNVSTLHKAADNHKLPYQLVNPGTKLEFKVVTVEDVIAWNQRRDPSRRNAGRPKKSDK